MNDMLELIEKREGFSIYRVQEESSGLGSWLIFDTVGDTVEEGFELARCTTHWGALDLMDKMIRGVVAIPRANLNKRLNKAQYTSDTFNRKNGDETDYCPLSFRTKQPSDT